MDFLAGSISLLKLIGLIKRIANSGGFINEYDVIIPGSIPDMNREFYEYLG